MRSRKPSRGPKSTIQPRTHPQNTHETLTRARDHHLKTLTDSQRSHIIGQRSHCANFSSRWPPGRTDGRRTDGRRTTHKFARRAPATGESSRARSFARSHARTQRKRKRNRNRFPGSGVGLKPAPHPQPPIYKKICISYITYNTLHRIHHVLHLHYISIYI